MSPQQLLLGAILWLTIWVMDWIDPPVHFDLLVAFIFAAAAFGVAAYGKRK